MGWRRWRGATFRRGRRWDAPVSAAVWIPPAVGSRSSWTPPPRRRRRFEPPVTVPAAPASPWTVTDIRTRAAWTAPIRRGRQFTPPPQFTPSPPPAYIPEAVGARHSPPGLSRRGRFGSVPITLPVPAAFLGARPGLTVRARRGRYANPPWLDVPPPPQGGWLPGWRAPRRTRPVRPRPGRFLPTVAAPFGRGSLTPADRGTATAQPAARTAAAATAADRTAASARTAGRATGSATAPSRTGPTMTGA